MNKEQERLDAHYKGDKNWLKWGPYLSERQWGTVREDYSEHGEAWDYFPHDHARSRVYRWGEDGIAGITDKFCHLNFAVALWNGKDPIIKERLFGLTGPQGNHAEDVKELYYYLDSTPTHSYMKHLYKYPHAAFPYEQLVQTNRHRSKQETEFEILDTGVFDNQKYFDVFTEYAKADEEDLLIKISVHNRSNENAPISVLPNLWFTNLWSFGLQKEKPVLELTKTEKDFSEVKAHHAKLGDYYFYFEKANRTLFSENETNTEKLYGQPNGTPRPKDAVNDAVISGDYSKFDGVSQGTKFSPLYETVVPAGKSVVFKFRLSKTQAKTNPLKASFDKVFKERLQEADEFYKTYSNPETHADLANIQRQAFAGMLWSKQYYYIDIPQWLNGDPGQVPPPEARKNGRNSDWKTLNNQDIISMPDKWEYPWYAAWDLAFHCVPLAMVDANFAKEQLVLFLREWYMKPNGQLPAYEWAFGDVNPPVHAWGCLQVYRIEKEKTGKGDVNFLKKVFQKLLINFTWWVNRKDHKDNNIFEGGFLGLDNIGVFDRSSAIPGGGHLEQADGTSWMAMYSLNMLDMALEIAQEDPVGFEDVATKFLEHFVYIAEALNQRSEDWTGSWDEEDGFFYDVLGLPNGSYIPLKVRSLVGLTTLFATLVVDKERLENLPDFKKRLFWFKKYRSNNMKHLVMDTFNEEGDMLLSLVPKDRLEHVLKALLSKNEFFSPYGIRAVSKIHETPYVVNIEGQDFGLTYEPAESTTSLFGGNSNWRGPIWMPMNFLLIQSLKELDRFYSGEMHVSCPTDDANLCRLGGVANDISNNLIKIFERDENGKRPAHALHDIYEKDPYFKELVLFYEYFHGDNGRGVGASHQTGWTGLVAELIACKLKTEKA
ncbi:MAG: glucosidase [Flavobacteriaceae bacterium]|nr:glucosidase [Flavobacteriaceae bacterium]